MADTRLLVINSDTSTGRGFPPEIRNELTEAALADLLDSARSLPPRLGIRTIVCPSETNGHIPGENIVQLFTDCFSSGAQYVCLLETKAPQIPMSYILEAFGRLAPDRASAVAGPTHGGGWYLLGASRTFPYSLLKDIYGGAANVLTERAQRTAAGELSLSLLPSLQSLETPSDGQRLLRDMRRGVAAAPRTQYTLRKLLVE